MLRISRTRTQSIKLLAGLLLGLLILSGCGNMREQPKHQKPFDSSELFGSAAWNLDPNAVPRGYLNDNEALVEGTESDQFVDEFPIEITAEVVAEGRRLYEGMCTPCHGYSGHGDGVVALEGYPEPGPLSFHTERGLSLPVGEMYSTIKNGSASGWMFSYAARIPNVEDRWAVVAYIRALQLSQNASDSAADQANAGS